MKLQQIALAVLFAMFALVPGTTRAADAPANNDRLSSILVPGEEWQVVAENLGFSDGACADADGNLYFSDLKKGQQAIYRLSPDLKQTKIADVGMSGNKIGPDGRLYGCGGGKVMAFELPSGKATTLAEGLKTNDLVVTHQGFIYITETGKHQVTFLDIKTGKTTAADIGIKAPNGIAMTPDQTHLLVSDYAGLYIWSFAIGGDGSLSDKKPAMKMQAPEKTPTNAKGDGMTVDTVGRVYVTTALGLQIIDPSGEVLGILPKPQPGLTNAAFAGKDLNYLCITCGTKVYRRKTQAKGALFFQAPLPANAK